MKTINFEDLVEINPKVKFSPGESYPFVPMASIEPGRRYANASEFRESGGGVKFCGGDTLFARITPCLENGKIAQFNAPKKQKAFGSTEYWVFREKEDVSDSNFIFYLCMTDIVRKPAERSMSGASGRQRADIDSIRKVQVPDFGLNYQRRIAAVLSAYDDLIENNTRRIEIFEEMARRLYEEWFVHFHFPGHDEVNCTESEFGRVPEGWNVVQLTDISDYIARGISPKYAESNCRVINQKCIRDNRLKMSLSREQVKGVPEPKYVRFGDVLINSTGVGTLGRVAQVYESLKDVTVDSHVTIVRPRSEININFFGMALQWLQPHFEGLGVGATGQTELSRIRVGEVSLVLPPSTLQEKFGELIKPMREGCINLGIKNANLRAQRDLLLPKLVSGEIDVSDISMPEDKEVSAA